MVKYFFSFLFLLSNSYGEELCLDTKMKLQDFVEKNEDIIRVFEFSGGSSRGNHLIIDSLKKKYPINHQFQFKVKEMENGWSSYKTNLHDVYWGIEKVDYKNDIVGSVKNCFLVKNNEELIREVKKFSESRDGKLYPLVYNFEFESAEKLISKKDFFNSTDERFLDSLFFLISNNPDLAKLMIEKGSPIENLQNNESALLSAVWNSREELVEEILKRKPSINFYPEANGYTSLILAASAGNLKLVKMLLDAGADPKPIPPHYQNVLCALGGARGLSSHLYRSSLNEALEVTKLLVAKGADPNAPCNIVQKNDTPFTELKSSEHAEILKYLLDNGLKFDKSYSKMFVSGKVREILKAKGYESSDKIEAEYLEYKKNSLEDLTTLPENKRKNIISSSVRFNEFDQFKKIVKLYKKDLAYVFCSSQADLLDNSVFFNHLVSEGLSVHTPCKDMFTSGEKGLVYQVINDCRPEHLKNISDQNIVSIKVSKAEINEMFHHWDFKRSDYAYDCMQMITELDKRGAEIDKLQFLRKLLETGSDSYLDHFINSKFIDEGLLQLSLATYRDDDSLFPQNGNFESKAISKDFRNYLFYRIKQLGIVSREEASKKWPAITFFPKEKYLVCSFESEVSGSKTKGDQTPLVLFNSCSELKVNKQMYFELYEEKDGFLAFVSLDPKFYSSSDDDLLLGSKVYLLPEMITTPFYLSDGTIHLALSKGGLKEVVLQGNKLKEIGDDNICKGVDEPIITFKPASEEGLTLPEGFDIKKAKIKKSFRGRISDLCKVP